MGAEQVNTVYGSIEMRRSCSLFVPLLSQIAAHRAFERNLPSIQIHVGPAHRTQLTGDVVDVDHQEAPVADPGAGSLSAAPYGRVMISRL
jgi:hypothetical protein